MKKSLRCIRWLASIASLALFVYVLERSGPAAVFNEVLVLGWGFADGVSSVVES
jgi:hypothetical protein